MRIYYLLQYQTVQSFITKREEHRALHLEKVKEAFEKNHLILGGALENPDNEALLIFCCENEKIVHDFAKNDPYVIHGLITNWTVRKWNVVIGKSSSIS